MSTIKLIISKEFLRLSVLLTIIYFFLEGYYHFFISDNFEYLGYYPDFSIINYIITKLVYIWLLSLSWKVYQRSKFLYSIYLLLMFFFYIPNAVIFAFSNMHIGAFVSNVFFVSFFSLSSVIKFRLPTINLPEKINNYIILALSLLAIVPIIITFRNDVHLKTLLLQDIYEVREVFSEKLTGYLGYLYNILVKTLLPIALVYFLIKRKVFFVGIIFLALMYLYLISGNKIVYFTSILLLFFYYLGYSYTSKMSNFFIMIIGLLIIAPFVDAFLFSQPILQGVFINRFLFIPALLTQWYFEFFDGNPYYFAESHFFNQFVEQPYDLPIGFLLAKIHWHEPTVYVNNGIVSDGFMNLGYLGVVLFSVIFTLLFSLFNSFKLHIGYFGLFFSYVYIFLSAPFLSVFITGGVMIFIIKAILLLTNKNKNLE
ncbi:MAG TPA: O-antigen polymerase [Vicingaceae bacterium]